MFKYDAAEDSIYLSPPGCINYQRPRPVDLNKDGIMEFISNTHAPGNCDPQAHYSDAFSWLTVLDADLKFVFPPRKMGSFPSNLSVVPIMDDKNSALFVMNIYSGAENDSSALGIFNFRGEAIRLRKFKLRQGWLEAELYENQQNKKTVFILKTNGQYLEMDSKFEELKQGKLSRLCYNRSFDLDLDGDQSDEHIFICKDKNNLLITRNDFSHPITVEIESITQINACSLILENGEQPQLFVSANNFNYTFRYHLNPLFYIRYIIYGGVMGGAIILMLLLQKVQKDRVEKKYKTEKQIAELQLRSIKNQLDPHFTLNIINSIGSLFYKKDEEKANYIFGKYAKLLRSTILSSDHISISLREEIAYVDNYLSLEQFRMQNDFKYAISFDPAINLEINVPKMLLHTFVENAIKHGLKHLTEPCELTLKIMQVKSDIAITINDNGIGRAKAVEMNAMSTGKGLKILDQILDMYETLEKIRILYSIIDKCDNNDNAIGTEVRIIIPQHG